MTAVGLFGWCGVVAILAAYALNAFGALSSADIAYHLLNFAGAFTIVVASLRRNAYQPAVLNAVWCVVAAIALARLIFG